MGIIYITIAKEDERTEVHIERKTRPGFTTRNIYYPGNLSLTRLEIALITKKPAAIRIHLWLDEILVVYQMEGRV